VRRHRSVIFNKKLHRTRQTNPATRAGARRARFIGKKYTVFLPRNLKMYARLKTLFGVRACPPPTVPRFFNVTFAVKIPADFCGKTAPLSLRRARYACGRVAVPRVLARVLPRSVLSQGSLRFCPCVRSASRPSLASFPPSTLFSALRSKRAGALAPCSLRSSRRSGVRVPRPRPLYRARH